MGIGNIFVATTLAPLVVVLASVSLQLLTMGLEQLKKCKAEPSSHRFLFVSRFWKFQDVSFQNIFSSVFPRKHVHLFVLTKAPYNGVQNSPRFNIGVVQRRNFMYGCLHTGL